MPDPRSCANCLADLAGPYCHRCGQLEQGPDALSMRRMARDVLHDVTTLDTKTARSLLALFQPGRLTAAYLAGRRQPYLGPLKVYLLCAAIFFLAAPFAGFSLDAMTRGSFAALEPFVAARREARGLDPAHFATRFDLRFQTVYTAALSLSMLGGALMLSLLFRRQKRPFGAHVAFAIHYISFIYLLSILTGVIGIHMAVGPQLMSVIGLVVLTAYLGMGLRHVYGERPALTAFKTVAMILFGMVLDGAVNIGAVFLTLELV